MTFIKQASETHWHILRDSINNFHHTLCGRVFHVSEVETTTDKPDNIHPKCRAQEENNL